MELNFSAVYPKNHFTINYNKFDCVYQVCCLFSSLQLLLFVCGSKEKYRQLRDMHSIDSHMREVQDMCKKSDVEGSGGFVVTSSLPYDALISLVSVCV